MDRDHGRAPNRAQPHDDPHRDSPLRLRVGVVVISDVSDATGAGAVGENTALLDALLTHGSDLRSYVPVRDQQVVDALWDRSLGERVRIEVVFSPAVATERPAVKPLALTVVNDGMPVGGRLGAV